MVSRIAKCALPILALLWAVPAYDEGRGRQGDHHDEKTAQVLATAAPELYTVRSHQEDFKDAISDTDGVEILTEEEDEAGERRK